MRLLVTGGCGFIGSNFIRYILQHYSPEFVSNVDALTYAGQHREHGRAGGEIRRALRVLQGRHRQRGPDGRADVEAPVLRGDQFRGGVARGSQHQFAAEFHSHERRRHQRAARLRAPARREAVRANLDRRGLRLARTGGDDSPSNRRIDPSSPYSASKAGGGFAGARVLQNLRPGGGDHPLFE